MLLYSRNLEGSWPKREKRVKKEKKGEKNEVEVIKGKKIKH